MTCTKNDIIDHVCHKLGFSRKQSIELVETLIELIKKSLESEDDVLVSGFGKFCVKDKKARKGRNPATGEDAILPSRRVVIFKCSGKMRKRIG